MEEDKPHQPQRVKIWFVCGALELRSLNLTLVIQLLTLRKQLSHLGTRMGNINLQYRLHSEAPLPDTWFSGIGPTPREGPLFLQAREEEQGTHQLSGE